MTDDQNGKPARAAPQRVRSYAYGVSFPLDQWIADQMKEDEKAQKQARERVRDEVYGMRTEDIISGAERPAPKSQAKPKAPPPAWNSIEDQIANPTPGQKRTRRARRR